MRYLPTVIALAISAAAIAAPPNPATWKAGQILSQSSVDLGHGFRSVHRDQVNPPGHWEGVGHFAYLFYNNRSLCQCSIGEFSIAPTGQFVVFVDGPSGKLMLFHTSSGQMQAVRPRFVGIPESFAWDEAQGFVRVTFYQNLGNGHPNAKPITVSLR